MMDNALIFLGIALLIAVLGGLVVTFLHRDPDASADGVEEFQRIMSALAPDDVAGRPTDAVPTDVVPTDVVPTDVVPTDVVPTDVVPTDVVPTDGAPDGA